MFSLRRVSVHSLFDLRTRVCMQLLTCESTCVCSFEHNFRLVRLMRRVSTNCVNCVTWWRPSFH